MGRDGRSRSSSTARVHSATPEVRGVSGMMLPVWTEIEDDADAILGNTNRHLQSCEPEYWGFDRTGQPSVLMTTGRSGSKPSTRTDHTFPGAGRDNPHERRHEREHSRLHGDKITRSTGGLSD